jgi:hypothetical protein
MCLSFFVWEITKSKNEKKITWTKNSSYSSRLFSVSLLNCLCLLEVTLDDLSLRSQFQEHFSMKVNFCLIKVPF